MARGERPLDEGDTPLLRFAADLRALREAAGSPVYRELSRRANYSAPVLSEAAAGRKLPSLAVTLAYVRACGGDEATWEARWREVDAQSEPPPLADDREPPYPGLAAFQITDADRFFGRAALVAELLAQVQRTRLVGVFGASGSGKSSLLRAGLVAPSPSPKFVFTPGPHPLEECALVLASLTGEPAATLLDELTTSASALHLRVRQALADHPDETDLLLVIDQFEELFTVCADAAERQAFLAALGHATTTPRSRVRVVLGVRSDFFAHCARHGELRPALGVGQVLVTPMTPDELREAIIRPAGTANCTVDGALVACLVAEAVDQPGVLPLVSHALVETWRRRQGMTLTLAGYEQAGGIRHALARTAETVYTGLTEPQRVIARQVLLRLTALGAGTEDTKRRISRTELDQTPLLDSVLTTLAGSRLITLDHDSVDLTHEALIGHWPRLREWLDSDREGRRVHQQLAEAAAIWESLNCDASALYRGMRLVSAEEWQSRTDWALSRRERQFLHASLAARSEEENTNRRRDRRLRTLVVVLAVLLLAVSGTTIAMVTGQLTIARQRDSATVRGVIDQLPTVRARDPLLADELALMAYRLDPTPETRGLLVNSASNTTLSGLSEQPHEQAAFSAAKRDGAVVFAAAARNGSISLNTLSVSDGSIKSHATILPSSGLGRPSSSKAHSLAVSSDGRKLAVSFEDGIVNVWDIGDANYPVLRYAVARRVIVRVSFSADGALLAIGGSSAPAVGGSSMELTRKDPSDRTAQVWDTADLSAMSLVASLPDTFGPITFSADNSVLVATLATSEATVAQVWRLPGSKAGNPVRMSSSVIGLVNELSMMPNGERVLASVFERGGDLKAALKVLNIGSGDQLTVTATSNTVSPPVASAFSADGGRMALADADCHVSVWDTSDLDNLRELAVFSTTFDVTDIAFVSGDELVLTDGGGSVLALSTNPDVAGRRICASVRAVVARGGVEAPRDDFFPGMNVPDPC